MKISIKNSILTVFCFGFLTLTVCGQTENTQKTEKEEAVSSRSDRYADADVATAQLNATLERLAELDKEGAELDKENAELDKENAELNKELVKVATENLSLSKQLIELEGQLTAKERKDLLRSIANIKEHAHLLKNEANYASDMKDFEESVAFFKRKLNITDKEIAKAMEDVKNRYK